MVYANSLVDNRGITVTTFANNVHATSRAKYAHIACTKIIVCNMMFIMNSLSELGSVNGIRSDVHVVLMPFTMYA